MTGLAGLAERSQAVTLSPGRPTSVEFELPAGLDLRGQVAHIRLEPADALPSDDHFFLALDQQAALRVLLVEPDAGSGAALTGTGRFVSGMTPRPRFDR